VAVLVDDEVRTAVGDDGVATTTRRPRDATEIQKLQNLVAAAVGIDVERGDQITVENIAFGHDPVPVEPEPSVWTRVGDHAGPAARVVALVVIVGLVLLLFVRPVVTRVLALPASAGAGQTAHIGMPQQLPRTVEDIEGEIEAQLDEEAMAGMDRRKPVLTRRVVRMATSEPANAAKLVRSWLAERRG
jgi:flagellar M-ring protein FliF